MNTVQQLRKEGLNELEIYNVLMIKAYKLLNYKEVTRRDLRHLYIVESELPDVLTMRMNQLENETKAA